jgi:hypothetical protein
MGSIINTGTINQIYTVSHGCNIQISMHMMWNFMTGEIFCSQCLLTSGTPSQEEQLLEIEH